MSAVAVIILQKTERISELLEERSGVKVGSLERGLRRVHLPSEARAAGRRLAAAARKAQRGDVAGIDAHRFDDDYRLVLRHLQAMEQGALRPGFVKRFLIGGATAAASGFLLGVGLAYAGLI